MKWTYARGKKIGDGDWPTTLGTRQSFLVLFFKKEQNFFFVKKKQETFVCLGCVSMGECDVCGH
jgi:hypothetical protein